MSRTVTLDNLVIEHEYWTNPRSVTALDVRSLRDLGDDILARGQVNKIKVQRIKGPDDTVIELVLDGQRRTRALELWCKDKKKGLGTVDVLVEDYMEEVIEFTPEIADKIMLDMLASSKFGEKISSFEEVETAVRLLSRGEKDQDQVANALKRSVSWVSRMMRAYRLASPLLIDAFRKTKVTDETFKDLAEVNPHDKQEAKLNEFLGLRDKGTREAKSEARAAVKDAKLEAREEREKAKENAKPAKKTAKAQKATSKTNGPIVKERSTRPMLQEIISLTTQKRPTDPYVQGIADAAAYARGEITPETFKPAWRMYVRKLAKQGIATPEGLGGMQLAEKKARKGKTKKASK